MEIPHRAPPHVRILGVDGLHQGRPSSLGPAQHVAENHRMIEDPLAELFYAVFDSRDALEPEELGAVIPRSNFQIGKLAVGERDVTGSLDHDYFRSNIKSAKAGSSGHAAGYAPDDDDAFGWLGHLPRDLRTRGAAQRENQGLRLAPWSPSASFRSGIGTRARRAHHPGLARCDRRNPPMWSGRILGT